MYYIHDSTVFLGTGPNVNQSERRIEKTLLSRFRLVRIWNPSSINTVLYRVDKHDLYQICFHRQIYLVMMVMGDGNG